MGRRYLVVVAALVLVGQQASAKVGARDLGGYVGTDSLPGTPPTLILPAYYLDPSPSPSPASPGVDVTIADPTALVGQDDAVFSIQSEMNTAGTVHVYGTTLSNCFAHTNGIVTCQSGGPIAYFDNKTLPDNRQAGLFVFAPFWDDLVPTATSSIAIQRSTGNYFWVQWNDFALAKNLGARLTFRVTFQVNATQGAVLFQYFKVTGTDGASATIGIQHSNGFTANQYSFNTAGAVVTGAGGGNALQAILFDIDADGDRLSLDMEKRFGTSDANHDTDGAGQDDGCEVANGKDPNNAGDDGTLSTTDVDSDTLTAAEEAFYGTNATAADSDGDSTMTSSLKDQEEIYGLTGGFHTNPTKADTDADGTNDGVEIDGGTDPLNPNSRPPFPEKDLTVGGIGKYHARAAVDGNGKVHIVGGTTSGPPVGVYYYMVDPDGKVRIPETLLKADTFDSNVSARFPTIQVFGGKVYITYELTNTDHATVRLVVLRLNPANAPQDGTPVLGQTLVESEIVIDSGDVPRHHDAAVGSDGIHLLYMQAAGTGEVPHSGWVYKHYAFDGTLISSLPLVRSSNPGNNNRGGMHRGSRGSLLVDSDGTVHLAIVAKKGSSSGAVRSTYYASVKNGQLSGPYRIGTMESNVAIARSGNLLYLAGGGGGGRAGTAPNSVLLAIFDPKAFSVANVPADHFGIAQQIDPASMVLPLTAVNIGSSRVPAAGVTVLGNGAVLTTYVEDGSGVCIGAFAPTGLSLGDPLCMNNGVPRRQGGHTFDPLPLPGNQVGVAYTKGQGTDVFYGTVGLSRFNFTNIPMPPAQNDAPVITSTPGQAAAVGIAYTYNATATDGNPAGGALNWSLVSGPMGLGVAAGGAVTWTPASTQLGTNNVIVQVCDTGAPQRCTSQAFGVAVTMAQGPVITSSPGTTAIAGKPYAYQVIATDAVSPIASYGLVAPSPAPGNMAMSATGLLTWTPTSADVGASSIQLKVTDAAMLSATQGFTLTVLPPGSPYFTSIPATTAVQGVAYSYQAVAVDPSNPAATFNYTLTSTPSGNMAISSSGALTWTPSGSEHGSVNVTIQADATGGVTATQSFTVQVLSQNVEAASNGCGCTVGEAGGHTGLGALLLLALGAFVLVRRRRA